MIQISFLFKSKLLISLIAVITYSVINMKKLEILKNNCSFKKNQPELSHNFTMKSGTYHLSIKSKEFIFFNAI